MFIAVLLFSTFVLFFHMASMAKETVSVGMCPFSAQSSSVCAMTPVEHIQAWQSMFAALPLSEMVTLFSLLLAGIFFARAFRSQAIDLFALSSRQGYRFAYATQYVAPRPLQEAFSTGILNPKLF